MLKILIYPDKKLKQKSCKVRKVDETIRQLAYDMLELMKKNRGVGLSAVQVGKPIRLIVTGYTPPLEKDDIKEDDKKCDIKKLELIPEMILINPKITAKSKEIEIIDEGCLSVPGIEIPIKRSIKANILAQDLDGHRLKIRAKDLFARVLQHEIDHLDGILIYDRCDKKTLKKLKDKKKKSIRRAIL